MRLSSLARLLLLLLLTLHEAGVAAAKNPNPKTVLLAILARNKAHVLPDYLTCIDNLTYRKKDITVYINTNNNDDETKEILERWAQKNQQRYRKIIFEAHEIKGLTPTRPHEWTSQRFKVLGEIRNKSLQAALENQCAYYFVVDCDNFINPCTLKVLVNKDLPIIAPMLKAIPIPNDAYSNYLTKVRIGTQLIDSSHDYKQILKRQILGTFEVPVVHCTYLIKSEYIKRLSYTDTTPHHEFIILSRCARQNGVAQYICNEKEFGTLLHLGTGLTLAEERARVKQIGSLIPNCGSCCKQ